MLIDFHTHCFPDAIAQKAMEKLSFASGGLKNSTDGTFSGLKDRMSKDGIDVAVVMNIATNAHQQKNVNDFAASVNNGKDVFAFGSVYPDSPDVFEELERIKDLGLKGVKLHPDYQNFFVDDEKMIPIYKKISQLGLITTFHAGKDFAFCPPYHCTPGRLKKVLKYFSFPVIAAHWGGVNYSSDVIDLLCGSDVYFDTSLGYSIISKCQEEVIIEKHGSEKILFGTDTPWHTAEMELTLLNTLNLSENEFENITYKNAQKLLGI